MEPDPRDPVDHLLFYCRDCRSVFDAAPDGTGYDQAPCPACGEICLTVEFEREEEQRNAREEGFASFLSSLMGLGGLTRLTNPFRRVRRESRKRTDFVTIVRYEARDLAEADVKILGERGIDAVIEDETLSAPAKVPVTSSSFALRVPAAIAIDATHILQAAQLPDCEATAANAPSEDIVFPCSECGGLLSFPASSRGRVETCRWCCEYVDVPD